MIVGGGDEVSVVSVVYTHGTVSVSSLGSFSSFGSLYKRSRPSLHISLGLNRIQWYFNNKRGRKRKYINPQEEKARHEEQRKKMRFAVQAKLVLGYWELVPMESGADDSSYQDTATVTKELEEP